jgi:potassium-transporting ATPase potassium-binding subunit
MNANAYLQLALFVLLVGVLAVPIGHYLARVYRGRPLLLERILGPLERTCYRLAGIPLDSTGRPIETGWLPYLRGVLALGLVSVVAVYALQRAQGILPGNPAALLAVHPALALDTAVSFATNTNWQAYSGETTLSYLTQMLGLGTQNFVSAATGMAVFAAVARAFGRRDSAVIGNFWQDLVRTVLYVLLPLSLLWALLLVGQGVVQSFDAYMKVSTLQGGQQLLPLGPVASQVAIKQLGTNGGGYFGTNSAHPFENPTALSNLLQMVAILLLPAACCVAFGDLVRDRRQGRLLLLVMTCLLAVGLGLTLRAECSGNPVLDALGVDQTASALQSGGNMEGKEARFGPALSATWAVATTAASNGSVNSMHDSFTPLGGLVPMVLMQLGEVVFGGVGSGLYGMLLFCVVAVFVAGLMIGRTPDYLGKKIEPFEMKMAMLGVLVPTACVLLGTALAVSCAAGHAGIHAPGAHGFSDVLYAFSSAGNNNGSAFAGLAVDSTFYHAALGLCMVLGRYAPIAAALAIAGSIAQKRKVATGPGTLPTHTVTFGLFLTAVLLLVGALTFFPALSLGPVAEQLSLAGER